MPGTNVVTTTWHTPGGWVEVQDALIMGYREGPDTVTPHTRPPADADAHHMLVRTVRCLDGMVEMELFCEPVGDYGRQVATWTAVGDDGHVSDAVVGSLTLRLATDMALGVEGDAIRARHLLQPGESAFCALSWAADLAVPSDAADAQAQIDTTVQYWRLLAGQGPHPRPSAAARCSSGRRWRSRG